jgi:hypothetical protein
VYADGDGVRDTATNSIGWACGLRRGAKPRAAGTTTQAPLRARSTTDSPVTQDGVRREQERLRHLARKARLSLDQVAALNPKTKLDAAGLENNETRMLNGRAEAKNARGALKTLQTKVDSFKKLAAKITDAASKTAAATQLSASDRMPKDADKDATAPAAVEAKAEKKLAAIKKP